MRYSIFLFFPFVLAAHWQIYTIPHPFWTDHESYDIVYQQLRDERWALCGPHRLVVHVNVMVLLLPKTFPGIRDGYALDLFICYSL